MEVYRLSQGTIWGNPLADMLDFTKLKQQPGLNRHAGRHAFLRGLGSSSQPFKLLGSWRTCSKKQVPSLYTQLLWNSVDGPKWLTENYPGAKIYWVCGISKVFLRRVLIRVNKRTQQCHQRHFCNAAQLRREGSFFCPNDYFGVTDSHAWLNLQ